MCCEVAATIFTLFSDSWYCPKAFDQLLKGEEIMLTKLCAVLDQLFDSYKMADTFVSLCDQHELEDILTMSGITELLFS